MLINRLKISDNWDHISSILLIAEILAIGKRWIFQLRGGAEARNTALPNPLCIKITHTRSVLWSSLRANAFGSLWHILHPLITEMI